MPLVYQQNINPTTKLGVWHIAEPEAFFLRQVNLQREITHSHKRLQHLAGRYLLKELYPDFPFELIRIADTRKPFLENEAYHFSISHCGPYAAVILSSNYRVGVDVELTTDKVDKVKHKFLSANEQDIIEEAVQLTGVLRYSHLLTAAWSIKESLYKWYGNGEVNFKEHLHIEKLVTDANEGIAYCRFLKDANIPLQVHFLFFNENCLSWVLNNVS
ncbi:MAG: 4'-phosphopantetheinyl transferase superfamily protein [Ferruginibacter sp.]